MSDIRRTLATAVETEPLISVDKERVIRLGRRRLLRRRVAVGGASALAVGAVVLSSTFLLGGSGQSEELPVAAPKTTKATTTTPQVSVNERLTRVLVGSGIVPEELTLKQVAGMPKPLQFRDGGPGRHEATTDVVDKQGKSGNLFVMISAPGSNEGKGSGCQAPITCAHREIGGRRIELATIPTGDAGEILLMAFTELPDGTKLHVTSSNVSAEAMGADGKASTKPSTPKHLITLDQVGQIAGLADLKL